jgi:hypothetical protein
MNGTPQYRPAPRIAVLIATEETPGRRAAGGLGVVLDPRIGTRAYRILPASRFNDRLLRGDIIEKVSG